MHKPACWLESLRALCRYDGRLKLVLMLIQLALVNVTVVIRACQENGDLRMSGLPLPHLPTLLIVSTLLGCCILVVLLLTWLRYLRQSLKSAWDSRVAADVRLQGIRVTKQLMSRAV